TRRGSDRGERVGRVRVGRRAGRTGARWACAAARSAPVLLEEREVGARAATAGRGRAGVLGDERLPQLRRSLARTAVLGRLTWLVAEVTDTVTETPRGRTLVLDVAGWAGHRAGQHVDVR